MHTPSITFWLLPPNSARIGYTTEGALFISVQLSTDAVSTLWKAWVLICLWKQYYRLHISHSHRFKLILCEKTLNTKVWSSESLLWGYLSLISPHPSSLWEDLSLVSGVPPPPPPPPIPYSINKVWFITHTVQVWVIPTHTCIYTNTHAW